GQIGVLPRVELDAEPISDAKRAETVADAADRLASERIILQNERDAIGGPANATEIELEVQTEGMTEVDALTRHFAAGQELPIWRQRIGVIEAVVLSAAVANQGNWAEGEVLTVPNVACGIGVSGDEDV